MEPSKNTHLTSPKANFIVIALFGFLLTGCDNVTLKPVSSPIKPDSTIKPQPLALDNYSVIRQRISVYEFTPVTIPNKQCLFVSGSYKGGLTCFDKEVQQ